MGITAPAPPDTKEGDSIVEYYGLKKRQEEEDEEEKKTSPENEGCPSGSSFTKYDLQSLRKYGRLLNEGEEVVVHEKIHGCNAMYWHDGSRLWSKSHYAFKKETDTNQWWIAAKQNELASRLAKYPEYAWCCELYGKTKSFRYDSPLDKQHAIVQQIRFFDVLNVKTMEFLDWDDARRLITEVGLKAVPEIFRGAWKGKEHWALADGQSLIGSHIREGIVVRPMKERVDVKYGRVILKHKSEAFLLKHG
jgi:RNA ligase (TIGR02306 family)